MKDAVKKITAAVLSAFTLITCTSYIDTGYYEDIPDIICSAAESSDIVAFDDLNDAALYLREQMKNRVTTVNISVPCHYDNAKSCFADLFELIFEETGVPDEGDYLRYGLYGYNMKYSANSKITKYYITLDYFTTLSQEKIVDTKVKEILNKLDLTKRTEYDKIKLIYNYVIQNVSYAEKNRTNTAYSAYGALVNGEAVCQGFSQLFYRLATEAGLSCRIIAGKTDDINHTWIAVAVDDLYYLLDPTWDSNYNGLRPNYFLKGSYDFDEHSGTTSHVISTGKADNPGLYPDYTSHKFDSQYPIAPMSYSVLNPTADVLLGDVDLDGVVTANDASATLNASVELSSYKKCHLSLVQQVNADVTGDGMVAADDATIILSYATLMSSGRYNYMTVEEYIENYLY